jgi:hypothetical protein
MRSLILAAGALLCGTSAMAQTTTAPADAGTTMQSTTTTAPADSSTMSQSTTAPADGTMAAQSTTTAGSEVTPGPTTKVIAMGDHYTVHRVMPDGTVMVRTLAGKDAKTAMKNNASPEMAFAAPASADAAGMTTGAGTAAAADASAPNVSGDLPTALTVAPVRTAMAAPTSTSKTVTTGNTTTTTTVQVTPRAQPQPSMTTGAGEPPVERSGERG